MYAKSPQKLPTSITLQMVLIKFRLREREKTKIISRFPTLYWLLRSRPYFFTSRRLQPIDSLGSLTFRLPVRPDTHGHRENYCYRGNWDSVLAERSTLGKQRGKKLWGERVCISTGWSIETKDPGSLPLFEFWWNGDELLLDRAGRVCVTWRRNNTPHKESHYLTTM